MRFATPDTLAPLSAYSGHHGPLEVVFVDGDSGATQRLLELGFSVGSCVRLIRAGNPAIVEAKGSRFALGAEFLAKIFARPTGGPR